VGKGDSCLTLTSGGCNAINMCLQGATSVTAVDCNPAQSALLEMKAIAIRWVLDYSTACSCLCCMPLQLRNLTLQACGTSQVLLAGQVLVRWCRLAYPGVLS
jgi:Protein of unknown function (DUF3419)